MLWSNYLQHDYDFKNITKLTSTDEILAYLYNAVTRNNVMALKQFKSKIGHFYFTDSDQETILHLAVRKQKFAIFDYLLSSSMIEIDAKNIHRETALVLSVKIGAEELTMKLIEKGADVTIRATPTILLHKIILDYSYSFVCELLMKLPGFIDITDYHGRTVLMHACYQSNIKLIAILLTHGADITILDKNGNSAFDYAAQTLQSDVLEIVFYYYFEDCVKYRLNLTTIIAILISESSIKEEFLMHIDAIDYDSEDLKYFGVNLHQLKIEYLIYLFENYSEIFHSLSETKIDWLSGFAWDLNTDLDTMNKLFLIMSDCKLATNLIANLHDINALSVFLYYENASYIDDITKFTLLALSYGLEISIFIIIQVYEIFGNCFLFKALLHMDLKQYQRTFLDDSIVHIYLNICTIADMFDELNEFCTPITINKLLQHFHVKRIRDIALATGNDALIIKISGLDPVPMLTELARNIVRDCIVHSLKRKEPKWFYTAVNSLPIAQGQKQLVTLERKIYI